MCSSRREMTRAKMFALFLGIALGGGAAIAFTFSGVWGAPSGLQKAVSIVHLLPVLFATLYVQGPVLRQPVLEPLGLSIRINRWWLVAWFLPVVVLGIGLLFLWAIGHVPVVDVEGYIAAKRAALPPEALAGFEARLAESPPTSPWMYVLQGLPAGVTINLLFALATEVGFRGFLFREIEGGFWRRSLLIGLTEAAFLLPIVALGYGFPDHPLSGAALMSGWCVLASPVLVYLRVRASSVIPVAMFRGTLMALTLAAAEMANTTDILRPFFGISGLVGIAVVLLVLLAHDRFVAHQRLATVSS